MKTSKLQTLNKREREEDRGLERKSLMSNNKKGGTKNEMKKNGGRHRTQKKRTWK